MLKNVNDINCFDQNKANMCSIKKHSVNLVLETGNNKMVTGSRDFASLSKIVQPFEQNLNKQMLKNINHH